MSAMSLINEFLLTTTARTRFPKQAAPRSSDLHSASLFTQILADIALQRYKVTPSFLYAGEAWGRGEGDRIIGVSIGIDENAGKAFSQEDAKIRQMLRDIQVEDIDNALTFEISDGSILYNDKMDLYRTLKGFIDNPENELRSSDYAKYTFRYHQGVPRAIQLAEYISVNASRVRNAMKEEAFAKDSFFAVESKPYLSKQHFLFASGVAQVAPVSISMTHLLKTICFEDGLEIPKGRDKLELPGELAQFDLNGGYN